MLTGVSLGIAFLFGALIDTGVFTNISNLIDFLIICLFSNIDIITNLLDALISGIYLCIVYVYESKSKSDLNNTLLMAKGHGDPEKTNESNDSEFAKSASSSGVIIQKDDQPDKTNTDTINVESSGDENPETENLRKDKGKQKQSDDNYTKEQYNRDINLARLLQEQDSKRELNLDQIQQKLQEQEMGQAETPITEDSDSDSDSNSEIFETNTINSQDSDRTKEIKLYLQELDDKLRQEKLDRDYKRIQEEMDQDAKKIQQQEAD